MRRILKYPLPSSHGLIDIPRGAILRCCGVQQGRPTLWCEVNDEEPMIPTRYALVATGADLEELLGLDYIGTVPQGPFIWHVHCSRFGETDGRV